MRARTVLSLVALTSLVLLLAACDGMDIGDLGSWSGTITVTNQSLGQAALVTVITPQSRAQFPLAAGTSQSLDTLLADKYTIEDAAWNANGLTVSHYKASLLALRSDLQDASLSAGDSPPPISMDTVLAGLLTVQTALQQLQASGFQACSHPVTLGGTNHATMTWTSPSGLGDVWELSCN